MQSLEQKFNARFLGLFLLACLLLISGKGYSLGYGVDVALLSASEVKVVPGQRAKFLFKVTNISDRDIDFVSKMYIPENFSAPIPDALHFSLVSTRYSLQEVNIYVPKATSPGRYNLRYVVEGIDNPVWTDSRVVIVNVVR